MCGNVYSRVLLLRKTTLQQGKIAWKISGAGQLKQLVSKGKLQNLGNFTTRLFPANPFWVLTARIEFPDGCTALCIMTDSYTITFGEAKG